MLLSSSLHAALKCHLHTRRHFCHKIMFHFEIHTFQFRNNNLCIFNFPIPRRIAVFRHRIVSSVYDTNTHTHLPTIYLYPAIIKTPFQCAAHLNGDGTKAPATKIVCHIFQFLANETQQTFCAARFTLPRYTYTLLALSTIRCE